MSLALAAYLDDSAPLRCVGAEEGLHWGQTTCQQGVVLRHFALHCSRRGAHAAGCYITRAIAHASKRAAGRRSNKHCH